MLCTDTAGVCLCVGGLLVEVHTAQLCWPASHNFENLHFLKSSTVRWMEGGRKKGLRDDGEAFEMRLGVEV